MCDRRHTTTHAFVLYGTHAFVKYHTCGDTYDRHETTTHKSWSHFWGKFRDTCICHMRNKLHMIHMIDMRQRHTTVGHIFGAIFGYVRLGIGCCGCFGAIFGHHTRARAAPHAYSAEREDSVPRQYVAQKKPLLSQNAYEQHKQTYPGTPSDLILWMLFSWRSNCILRQIKHTMRSLSEILTTRPHSRPPMCARRHTPTHAFVLYGTHAFVIYDTC